MSYLIFIFVTLVLFGAFLGLTSLEKRRGTRLLERQRAVLDAHVAQFVFIVTHVDFASFVAEEARRLSDRILHDIAHLSLLAIRAIERLLTRAVKHLRSQSSLSVAPITEARPFIKTLSSFKEQLQLTRPQLD